MQFIHLQILSSCRKDVCSCGKYVINLFASQEYWFCRQKVNIIVVEKIV